MGAMITGTATSSDQLIAAIKNLCSGDGWTIDLDTASRIHIHKGAYHFDVEYSGNHLYITGCSGYASGQPAASQPNAKTTTVYYIWLSGYPTYYTMISTGNNFYATNYTAASAVRSFYGFGVVVEKIGSWNGGQFVHGNDGVSYSNWPWVMNYSGTIYIWINGAWAPNASYGGLIGNFHTCALRSKMPFLHNAGLIKFPITLFFKDVSNSALLHPLGSAPNLYMARGGDVYAIGETITFDGYDYVCIGEAEQFSTVASLLVKLD